jgi:two-component system sensor histidine kinase KdpD
VLTNLLTNADKYSPAEEPIEVQVRNEGELVSVSVSDHGPGVPPDEIDRIFESFYRSAQTSGTSPGHGLGLTVCRRLVEKMGGTIGAVNRPEGGLRVTFTMPVAAPVATERVGLVYGSEPA